MGHSLNVKWKTINLFQENAGEKSMCPWIW